MTKVKKKIINPAKPDTSDERNTKGTEEEAKIIKPQISQITRILFYRGGRRERGEVAGQDNVIWFWLYEPFFKRLFNPKS